MKLKSLNKTLSLLIFLVLCSPTKGEEQIDIWNKTKQDNNEIQKTKNINEIKNPNILNTATINNNIKIENDISNSPENPKIFGIYEPAKNNFDLNMWSQTDAEKVRSSFKRINKIKLSNTASQLFENTILSIAHPPKGMDDKEFIDLLSAYAKIESGSKMWGMFTDFNFYSLEPQRALYIEGFGKAYQKDYKNDKYPNKQFI